MTRDEAVAYIQAHPKMFGDWPLEAILGRVHSQNDPDFYDPTLWVDPDAGNTPPAPAPRPKPRPVAQPVPGPAAPPPPKVMQAGMFGVPKGAWAIGIFGALALAFHKKIERAVR